MEAWGQTSLRIACSNWPRICELHHSCTPPSAGWPAAAGTACVAVSHALASMLLLMMMLLLPALHQPLLPVLLPRPLLLLRPLPLSVVRRLLLLLD